MNISFYWFNEPFFEPERCARFHHNYHVSDNITQYNQKLFIAQSNFICPEKDGLFEDTQQCDKYYDCFDGIPEDRLCPDGLVFDPFSRKREPCDHYFNVDCGDRLELRKFSECLVPVSL